MRKVCTTKPWVFWLSSSISVTRALKGCMVTLNDRSMNRNTSAPISSGAKASSLGQLGIRNRARVEMTAPKSMYGRRRPSFVQVPSENMPMIGCTTKPASGAASQKRLRLERSAPKDLSRPEVLLFCSE